jgi:two-component system chemotaxis sensor kinase CheA
MGDALADKAVSLTRLLVNVIGPNLEFDDSKAVAEALAHVQSDPDFAFVRALEGNGVTVARKPASYQLEEPGPNPALLVETRVLMRPGLIIASEPIVSGGRTIGAVEIGLRTTRLRAQVSALSVVTGVISFAGIVVAVVVVVLLALRIQRRNRDMAILLDSADQGFLSVDRAGVLAVERSRAAVEWLGPYVAGQQLWTAVSAVDARAGEWLQVGWLNLSDGVLPVAVAIDQLPPRIEVRGRVLSLEIKPRGAGDPFEQGLVVLTDITENLARERAELIGRDLVRILEKLSKDKDGLLEFLADADRLVHGIEQGLAGLSALPAHPDLLRNLHTLKGNCAIFGLLHVSGLCNEMETMIGQENLPRALEVGRALLVAWREMLGKLESLVGRGSAQTLEVATSELAALEARIVDGSTQQALLELVRSWRLEPIHRRFERIATQARDIARRLGRGDIAVAIEGQSLRTERERWLPFWRVFGHVVRNAIDHGLEPPEERAAAGKPAAGRLTLRALADEERTVIEIEDDGRGVDWPRVAALARARGLACGEQRDLVAALFADGLTTRDESTTSSGRGVGLSAVRAACVAMGGEIDVESRPGGGTTFRFSFPSAAQMQGAPRAA